MHQFITLREFGIKKAFKKLVISLIICTFIGDNQQVTNKVKAMITKDKVTEIFCMIDEFNKNLNSELENNLFLPTNNGKGKRYRNRKGRLSESEIMTILVCYHSVHTVTSRSITSTVFTDNSSMSFPTLYPTIVSWN